MKRSLDFDRDEYPYTHNMIADTVEKHEEILTWAKQNLMRPFHVGFMFKFQAQYHRVYFVQSENDLIALTLFCAE